MFNRRQKDFIGALRGVLGTEDGKKLFKYLTEDYVTNSSVQSSVELTYYKLGQKELLQGLMQDAKLQEQDLDPIKTINHYED
jgi:hypothetical protein